GFKRDNLQLFRGLSARAADIFERAPPQRDEPSLTPRELETLLLLARGNSDDQIASQLGIRKWTVISHLQRAQATLGCAHRAAAVPKAIPRGMRRLPLF